MLKNKEAFDLGVQRGKEAFWQTLGFDEGQRIAQKEAKNMPKTKLDEQEKGLIRYHQVVDKLFDEMVGKLFTTMEVLGVLTGADFDPPSTGVETKELAIKKLIRGPIREIQNRIKDEYPSFEELK